MPTAKKYYTFNETINKTGIATVKSEEAMMAYLADEGNYITAMLMLGTVEMYVLPMVLDDGNDAIFYVFYSTKKPLDIGDYSSWDDIYIEYDGEVESNGLSGVSCEITEIGANVEGWVAANTTTNGLEVPVESPNGVRLLLAGKTCDENIAVVPKLADGSATPSKDAQTVPIPEGFAGFRTFKVEAIPKTYVPEGYVPEGTVPEGYVPEGTVPEGYLKPEGEVVVTENVTGMDITDKKTLTVAVEGGVEMNVAFGDTAPDDTSKLWIKTAEPESLEARLSFDFVGNEQMQAATLALPSNVYQSCAAAVGKKIYIFGGSPSYSKAIYVYDTETNGIEQSSATLPSAVNGAACAAIGKRIYIFGGRYMGSSSGKSKAIHVFDTETSTFETLSVQLPEDRYNATAAAVGNKIYIFGGSYYNNGEKATSTVYLFNAESNAITSLTTSLSTKAHSADAVAVGSKIYVFGGQDGSTYHDTISVFDTETQTFAALEDVKLPIPSAAFAGAAVGSVIYLFGGRFSSAGSLNTIVRFNAETHGIETLGVTMPKNTLDTPAVAIGSKIYAFDGTSSAVDPALHTFTVHIDLPENHMLIEASGAGNTVRLFPNLEIGVKNVYLGNADGRGEKVPAALYRDGAWVEI